MTDDSFRIRGLGKKTTIIVILVLIYINIILYKINTKEGVILMR